MGAMMHCNAVGMVMCVHVYVYVHMWVHLNVYVNVCVCVYVYTTSQMFGHTFLFNSFSLSLLFSTF